MLLGHTDVVLADRSEWSVEPFSGLERDGHIWGRGALDMKGQVAAEAVAVATLAREGWTGAGDLIYCAVADEEVGDGWGLPWMTEHHPDLVRADYRDPYKMKREAWHRTWFNFGGINREVTVRPVGRSDIVGPTLTTTLDGGDAVVTVSAQIRALEHALDEKLFKRVGRRLELTDMGRTVYRYADEIFGLGRELLDTVKDRPTGRPMRLVVGQMIAIIERYLKLLAQRVPAT